MLSEMNWDEATHLIADHKGQAFQFEAVVHLDALLSEVYPITDDTNNGPDIEHVPQHIETALMARQIAREIRNLTGYRFMYVLFDHQSSRLIARAIVTSRIVIMMPEPEPSFSSALSSKGRRQKQG